MSRKSKPPAPAPAPESKAAVPDWRTVVACVHAVARGDTPPDACLEVARLVGEELFHELVRNEARRQNNLQHQRAIHAREEKLKRAHAAAGDEARAAATGEALVEALVGKKIAGAGLSVSKSQRGLHDMTSFLPECDSGQALRVRARLTAGLGVPPELREAYAAVCDPGLRGAATAAQARLQRLGGEDRPTGGNPLREAGRRALALVPAEGVDVAADEQLEPKADARFLGSYARPRRVTEADLLKRPRGTALR